MEKENNCGLVMAASPHQIKEGERERKIVIEGKMNFSFGKNGLGLTDELIQIGELVKTLSKDNHIYIEEAFIDSCDDIYNLKFHITPHQENEWMIKEKKE